MEGSTTFYYYFLRHPDTHEVRYVGKTVSPKHRIRTHMHEAKKNNRNKREKWITNILRNGKRPVMDVFYEESFSCRKDADSLEAMLIKKCKKHFRLVNGVDRGLGGKVSTKPVYQYCRNTGVFLKSYSNAFQAEIATGVRDCNLTRCCQQVQGYGSKSAGGYFWSYERMEKYPTDYDRGFATKYVALLNEDGTVFIFPSGRIASEATNTCRKGISSCVTGRQKTSFGRRWSEVK